MGLFDKFKRKKIVDTLGDEENVQVTESSENAETEDNGGRASLLERLQGGTPIFTDHESDIEYMEEYEAQQKEESLYRLREGLKKTKDGFVSKVELLINSFTKIDEDFFDELEETLILSDIGAETSEDICDKLRAEVKRTGTTEPTDVKQMLKNIISEILTGGNEMKLETKPSVIMVIGVNGAGKTTTIGKMLGVSRRSSSTARAATPRLWCSTRYRRQRRAART